MFPLHKGANKIFALRIFLPFSTMVVFYTTFRKEGAIMFNKKTKEMQKAIDLAWENPTEEERIFQKLYFPHGKPTVDEFIQTVANLAKGGNM